MPELDIESDVAIVAKGVPERIVRVRSAVLGHVVVGVCAAHEAQRNVGAAKASRLSVDYFLIEAATGMLSVPVTQPEGVLDAPAGTQVV